jgi:hypothetical protein
MGRCFIDINPFDLLAPNRADEGKKNNHGRKDGYELFIMHHIQSPWLIMEVIL